MGNFASFDGTRLAWHRAGGAGEPLLCVPGGPMMASAYLGDLGGLSTIRPLVRLDLRGTGESAVPQDTASYRADRQVADLEALRLHLGLDAIDLAAHSAGAAIALGYAVTHPDRVRTLTLINPSPRPVGFTIEEADRREVVEQRSDEPWFPTAYAALQRLWSGEATPADAAAIAPFNHGHWDGSQRAMDALRNNDAAAVYYAPGALDPERTRSALAVLTAPTLVISGSVDIQLPPKHAAGYAALFPRAAQAELYGGSHFAWLDDPAWTVTTIRRFLSGA